MLEHETAGPRGWRLEAEWVNWNKRRDGYRVRRKSLIELKILPFLYRFDPSFSGQVSAGAPSGMGTGRRPMAKGRGRRHHGLRDDEMRQPRA